jgi:hypothetical protein
VASESGNMRALGVPSLAVSCETGHFGEALHDLRDLRRDRRDLFWDRLGF